MDSRDIAYVQSLIGLPWQRRGHHCWWLVQDVQQKLFGRSIPYGDAPTVPRRDCRLTLLSLSAEDYGWHEVPEPVHGAVVRMHHVGTDPAELEHAGVYLALDGGRVLHTDGPHGVVFDSLLELEQVRGWKARFFVPMSDQTK